MTDGRSGRSFVLENSRPARVVHGPDADRTPGERPMSEVNVHGLPHAGRRSRRRGRATRRPMDDLEVGVCETDGRRAALRVVRSPLRPPDGGGREQGHGRGPDPPESAASGAVRCPPQGETRPSRQGKAALVIPLRRRGPARSAPPTVGTEAAGARRPAGPAEAPRGHARGR